jgi:hypothetical protein
MFTGKAAPPVSAEAVMLPFAPTFTVAAAKDPVPFVPETLTMPLLVVVATSATMSSTSVLEAENSRVFSPVLTSS